MSAVLRLPPLARNPLQIVLIFLLLLKCSILFSFPVLDVRGDGVTDLADRTSDSLSYSSPGPNPDLSSSSSSPSFSSELDRSDPTQLQSKSPIVPTDEVASSPISTSEFDVNRQASHKQQNEESDREYKPESHDIVIGSTSSSVNERIVAEVELGTNTDISTHNATTLNGIDNHNLTTVSSDSSSPSSQVNHTDITPTSVNSTPPSVQIDVVGHAESADGSQEVEDDDDEDDDDETLEVTGLESVNLSDQVVSNESTIVIEKKEPDYCS